MTERFRREDLANQLAFETVGGGYLNKGMSGIFLSAPRRTGKTDFVYGDLVPALIGRQAIPIVVHLVDDGIQDPGEQIAETIRATLKQCMSIKDRAGAMLSRVNKVSVSGEIPWLAGVELGFEVDLAGKKEGVPFHVALNELQQKTGKPIVLVLDNVLAAKADPRGEAMLKNLKAIRDSMNARGNGQVRFAMIALDSDHERLQALVMNQNELFYGASMQRLSPLGRDFVADVLNRQVGPMLDPVDQPSIDATYDAFKATGSRPENLKRMLRGIVDARARGLRPDEALEIEKNRLQDMARDVLRQQIAGLAPLQGALIKVMVDSQNRFRPFDADTTTELRALVPPKTAISNGAIARCLDSLEKKGMVWRAVRGVYHLSELVLAEVGIDPGAPDAWLKFRAEITGNISFRGSQPLGSTYEIRTKNPQPVLIDANGKLKPNVLTSVMTKSWNRVAQRKLPPSLDAAAARVIAQEGSPPPLERAAERIITNAEPAQTEEGNYPSPPPLPIAQGATAVVLTPNPEAPNPKNDAPKATTNRSRPPRLAFRNQPRP